MLLSAKAGLLYVWTLQNNPKWYNRLVELAWYDREEELFRKAMNYVRANNADGKIDASEEEMQDAVEALLNHIRLIVKRDKEELMLMWEKYKSLNETLNETFST